MKKALLFSIFAGLAIWSLQAQAPDYNHLSWQPNANFNTIANATQHYYDSTGTDTVKGSGFKQFKRWESFWGARVGDNTNSGSFQPAFEAFAEYANSPIVCNGSSYNEQWQFIGHSSTETGTNWHNWGKGQGILITVHVDMKHDPSGNTIYVGSRTGGLWRTRNAKTTMPTWVCLTNQRFPAMGVNSIAIDPNNSNIIYISTGISHGGSPAYGMGILKTTNGQNDNPTWNSTGLSFDINNPTDFIFTHGVYISPSSNSTIFGLMENEIWKSTNSGATFTKVFSLSGKKRFFRDLVFLPNDASTIVAASDDANLDDGGAVVVRSTNNGANWTNVTSSLGFTALKQRIDLAVTPANGDLVVACGGSPSAYEMSKSSNKGSTWTRNAVTLNSNTHLGIGYWENDLVISPDNETIMYLAGTVLTKSTNSGSSFTTLYRYWDGVVHPDVRGLAIRKDGAGNDVVYSAHDGGLSVSETSGSTWQSLNGTGLNITQIYGFDMNLNKDWIAEGTQDLGFYNYDNGTWGAHTYGDGIRMIFNPFETAETMYGQTNSGGLRVSTNRGASWGYLSGSGSTGSWERKMKFDGVGNMYIGNGKELYRKNAGSSGFSLIHTFTGATHHIWGIGTSKSNPNVVYVGFDSPTWQGGTPSQRLFKTTNALSSSPTWTDITADIPVNWMGISDIVVDPNNENQLWVATGRAFISGATTWGRIHYSSDGGTTFNTIDQGLNINSTSKLRFPVNVMILDEATGGMYIGTDIGVYYNPNPKSTTSSWVCYNRGFPATIVTDLRIDHCSRKIVASTFGRGLWESGMAEAPDKDETITASELLNVDAGETRLYYSDITIPSGKTMVVKGRIRMAPNRKITIEVGAKLQIDGGTITSTCDLPWGGIRVNGNSSVNQFGSNQGILEMKNSAKVSLAHNAVALIGLNSSGGVHWGKTGGVVRATNSTFENNRRDVEFMSYHPYSSGGTEYPNLSYFTRCNFITTADNPIPSNTLGAHVTMWDVNGARFRGCTFEDQRAGIFTKHQGRTGIYTINSTFSVDQYCSSPFMIPCSGVRSKFANLKSAIEVYSNGTRGNVSIQYTDFNCYKGVRITGTNSSVVRANNFMIGHDMLIPGMTDYPYGLYLDECQSFNTEGNQFTGTTAAANVNNGGAAGLVIRNTGANNNVFYRSNFDGLKVASQALSENRETGLTLGLRFRCNDYEDNFNDLDIREDPNNPSVVSGRRGMAELQAQRVGSSFLIPNNLFGNASPILNLNIENQGNWLQYIHNGPANPSNRFFPSQTTSNVLLSQTTNTSGCTNNLSGWAQDRPQASVDVVNFRPVMIILRRNLDSLVDMDDTPGLVHDVVNVDPGTIGTVFGTLMGASPWLSHEVLVHVAAADHPFSPEMVRDILVANPHASRSDWVQETLDNRAMPLPQPYRDQINQQQTVYTAHDDLAGEVAEATSQYDEALNELLATYYLDSSYSLSEIAPWLKHPHNPNYHYQLAEHYADAGDWMHYHEVADSIPMKVSLSPRQAAYHNGFSALYAEIEQWTMGGNQALFEADQGREDWLLNFAATHDQYPARVHALLAVNDTSIIQPDVYMPENHGGGGDRTGASAGEQLNAPSQALLDIYPNPGSEFIKISWKADAIQTQAHVQVFDVQGKLLTSMEWDGENALNLQVSDWPTGVYYVHFKTEGQEVITRKLLIQR
ncbi:MAG: T9SS type A sorting domain-containing protein [Bacteroidia bacterium]